MTSKIRNVTKQLLGAEDFIFNQGKQLQQRGPQLVEINSVDFSVAVSTEEDLSSLDKERYLKASVGHKKFVSVNGEYQETDDFTAILFKEGATLSEEFPLCRDDSTVARWLGSFPKVLTLADKGLIGSNWQVLYTHQLDWLLVGTFAEGFTFNAQNQVGIDSNGNLWSYNGRLPFTVSAGTVPSEPNYTNRNTASVTAAQAAAMSAAMSAEAAQLASVDLDRFLGEYVSGTLAFPLDLGWVYHSFLSAKYNLGTVAEGTTPPPPPLPPPRSEDFGYL